MSSSKRSIYEIYREQIKAVDSLRKDHAENRKLFPKERIPLVLDYIDWLESLAFKSGGKNEPPRG